MNRKYSILTLLAGASLLLSYFAGPPDGRSGAPGDGLCSDCHTNQGSQTGSIVLTGLPATIEPCTQYTLTITNSWLTGTAALAGFEITILNGSNNMAGVLSNPSQFSSLSTSGTRQYWKHMPAQMYPASHMVSWTATWTSPSGPANTMITAYAAGNIANGNGNNQGDKIVTSTPSGMLNGGAPALTVTITNVTNIMCNGVNNGSATATPAGGIIPYTYAWSNGATTQTISNLAAATYTVTVTDMCSSTKTATVTITQPPALVLNAPTINNVSCNGGNNGSITAHAVGGVSPYFYSWSNGFNGATNSNLVAGAYTVTVTDNNNCTKSATYQVTQPPLIVINLVSITNESCAGENDGAITISVAGGVVPIFAEWSNGFLGTTITGLSPDMYTVTVTDNNSCTKTATYTVNAGGMVIVNLNQLQNVTCPGGADGSISVTGTGGVSPYTYSWSNGANTSTITNLTAGSYVVTVTDSHLCKTIKGYMVTQPPPMVVQIMQPTQNLCFGDNTADLTSTASGGTSPYTALWSNGISGLNNSNLLAGTYTITVTDDHGCTGTKSATITDPPQITVNVTTTNETAVGANNGTATANAGGGTGSYSYLWSNGGFTSMITGLPPGMYTATVTDMNACSVSGTGQVNAFGCLLDVALGQDLIICEGNSTILLPSVTGASGNVTYLWTDGSIADSLLVSQGGEYCVTVMDAAGCQDIDCVVITEIIIPPLTCPVINESSPGAHDGAVQCDGVTGITSFLWSNGATTPSITGLSPGIYCVTVTDANGCTKSQCFNVQPGNCQLSITAAVTNVVCHGDSTGSIVLTDHNGAPPVTYAWSDGETTSTISNLGAGSYTVTVSDATGCFATDTYSITEPDSLSIRVDTVINISGVVQGSIHVTVSGGVPPYQYVWTLPDGSLMPGVEDLDNLTMSGNYQLGVMDSTGCIILSSQIFVSSDVAVNPEPKFRSLKVYPVPTGDVLIFELENPVTEVLISGIDGREYKRIINPGSNHINVSELQAGWYIIRISDGHEWYIARFVK